eukprot:gb/GECG01015298.1/.p1 GENE.gb/GECG01015298.1/~~gb/GECG01015298.1/.p1  ORF type:complete len:133 (+),score=27.26 gb/GECG01015298.1/:1-399(+)
MADHQDWTPQVIHKKGGGSGATTKERKFASGENKSAHSATAAGTSMKKLEEDDEHFAHSTVPLSLAKSIQKARMAKKMNQKQLASAICEKPAIITEYESGKAIPNPQIINKLEKTLETKLPRPNKKKGGDKK